MYLPNSLSSPFSSTVAELTSVINKKHIIQMMIIIKFTDLIRNYIIKYLHQKI